MKIRNVSRLGQAVIAMVAASATVCLQAEASPGINGPALQPYNVNATVAGMPLTAQTLWAVVAADGSNTRSFPRNPTTTSIKLATGAYEVDFYQNVNACSYQVTVGNGGSGSPPVGYASVAARSTNAKGVFVQTYNLNGALADEPFHLAVLC